MMSIVFLTFFAATVGFSAGVICRAAWGED